MNNPPRLRLSRLVPLAALALRFSIAPAALAAGKAPAMDDLIRLYDSDRGSVGHFYDLPWSPVRFDRLEKLHGEWLQRLPAMEFGRLEQPGRIDYVLLRNKLTSERARLALERKRLAQMDELLPFRKAIQDLERTRWKMESLDAQAAATSVAGIPEQLKKLRQQIEKGKKPAEEKKKDEKDSSAEDGKEKPKDAKSDGPPIKVSPSLARRTAGAVGELKETLSTWFKFYDGFQPDFSWWLKKPNAETAAALDEYAKFLREEIAGLKGKDEDPLLGDPIGAESLADDLAAEMIPYSPEELIAIGEREFAWCEARMKEAAQEMGLGDDWKAALARVKTQFVPPGKQDEFVVGQAHDAIRFCKEKNLVTIPPLCEEMWRLTMMSPDTQKTIPYAAYSGQNMMVAYAKDEMKHEDKLMSMRGNNRHFTRIVTAHELIPGHHLQLFHAARHRGYRSTFSTPFLVEGWSLYWELRLWDLNYAQSPEDRVGMLFWRMHRSARIIVSLKFHLGKMKPAEMVDFLVERVGHERFGATSEVRRFIGGDYSPLYQCGYMIGGMQLRALHHEVVEAGQMSDREFNDTVLTYGPIPIELIRAGILNLPLTRDAKAGWRFAGEQPGVK